MIKIEFPKEAVQVRQQPGIDEIFDPVRKKWLLLTPEEWVRQNIVQFLLQVKNYPLSLVAIEKEIKLGELKKRCDIVVYNREMAPLMIIECKEMKVSLSEKTLEQILRYHISLPATFLIISNGTYTYGFEKKEGSFFEINVFPDY
jgi:hypothetical protein